MIWWFSCTVVLLLIFQDCLLVYYFLSSFKEHGRPDTVTIWPAVSLLIPSRNEEHTLPACLTALEELDYPPRKIQIILADDQSSDRTGAIIDQWVSQAPNRVKVGVEPMFSHLNGKANALAQMAHVATGDLLLFTDADCQVNPKWVRRMVSAYKPVYGLVVGVTHVRRRGLLAKMQGQDWWLTLGMIKVTSDRGNLLTAVGNNMLISKKAYHKVGGFEGLSFSVTEDFAMGKAIKEAGYRPVFEFVEESLVTTKAETGVADLLKQRKRWMKGALSLGWYWQALLALQALFFPFVLSIIFFDPSLGLVIWGGKVFLQVCFVWFLAKKASISIPVWELFIFEVYYLVISWSTIVYYFWPSKINWKERRY
ncbi:glycosyl transferase [Echinicola strongylocentroti]|uniref:Glycosyl transferase n=1 Tax=Echinicola strongylocentroti TaxID=1795355 RepID=A0A2Z4IHB7_9BACT|nr:glycosyltransferase [Echinicola strongylocentroti]AWW29878.1 glycosyl transferase [Echinicola strongylocentroti]